MTNLARTLCLALGFCLLAQGSSAQNEDYSTLVRPQPIEQLRKVGRQGDFVTVQGRVLRAKYSENLFMLEDDGGRIIVKIPEYILREIGKPARNETIRVSGEYDHKTFVDVRSIKPTSDGSEWGIRVRQLDRQVESAGRNPTPDPAAGHSSESLEKERSRAPSTPAALDSSVTSPSLGSELKERMIAAKQRLRDSNKAVEGAEVAYARGMHTQVSADELAYLTRELEAKEHEQAQASAAIAPLAQEAREQGLDESMIRLYESGTRR